MSDSVDFISKNENYSDEVTDLIKDQYKLKPNYNKIVNVLKTVAQDYENILVESAEAMLFDRAIGAQLDEIGAQVNVTRVSDNDGQYRAIIALNTARLESDGTRDGLFNILSQYSAQDIKFVRGLDDQLDINLFAACIADLHGVSAILDLLPLNTYYRIIDTEGTSFGFDDDDGGFGSTTDPTAGGNWPSLLAQVDD